MAQVIQAGEFVGPGELRSAQYLQDKLDAHWVVICNKELPMAGGSTREVDFILVGRNCIVVLDEKSWSGAIHGNENGWVLDSGESFASPLNKAAAIARRLAGVLRSKVLTLEKQSSKQFVFEGVLLSHPKVSLNVRDSRTKSRVHLLKGVEKTLKQLDRDQATQTGFAPVREMAIECLTGLSDRPKIPKEVGDYEVLECLSSEEHMRCLLAKHEDGSIRNLKLIQRPTDLSEERRERIENVLLREYNVLKHLGSSGRAPQVDPYFSWDQKSTWVLPLHPLPGQSLRADRLQNPPSAEHAIAICKEAFEALQELHQQNIIHRSLNPDRIYLSSNGRIAFSDFIVARIEGQATVAVKAQEIDPDSYFRAPECRVHFGFAEQATDIYSLAASLLFWISGEQYNEKNCKEAELAKLLPDYHWKQLEIVESTLLDCLAEDERQRPRLVEVLSRLDTSKSKSAKQEAKQRKSKLRLKSMDDDS